MEDRNVPLLSKDQTVKPMLLEVPKDQYEQAVNLMRERFKEGKVAGVTDPEEAQTLVKAGCVTLNRQEI